MKAEMCLCCTQYVEDGNLVQSYLTQSYHSKENKNLINGNVT